MTQSYVYDHGPRPADHAPRELEDLDETEILEIVNGYYEEARTARETGDSPRDAVWELNWKHYHREYDFSNKAEWQAAHPLPKVSNSVERLAAALRFALVQPGGDDFEFKDPLDPNNDLAPTVKTFVKAFLENCGTNVGGQWVAFPFVFGQGVKAGALMMTAFAVTWDHEQGRACVDPVDARELYYDHTNRGLYRIRRYEVDRYELDDWALETDSNGDPIYDQEAIDDIGYSNDDEGQLDKEVSSGTGQEKTSARTPVVIHEYLCTLIDPMDGRALAKNYLVVTANERRVIRMEPNPWWHKRDWIVAAPLVDIPFSPYGTTYTEAITDTALAFIELTNLLRDNAFTSAMNAFYYWPHLLDDPSQLADGISPNMAIAMAEDAPPGIKPVVSLELGKPLEPATVAVWQGLGAQFREDSMQSELFVGQVPPKGDITAREIDEVSGGTNAIINHMATDIDHQILSPVYELVWWTALQHVDPDDETNPIVADLPAPILAMLRERREEFSERKIRLKASGVSGVVERGQTLRKLLRLLEIIGGNELLAKEFLAKYSLAQVVAVLVRLIGLDPAILAKPDAEILEDVRRESTMLDERAGGGGRRPGGSGAPSSLTVPVTA